MSGNNRTWSAKINWHNPEALKRAVDQCDASVGGWADFCGLTKEELKKLRRVPGVIVDEVTDETSD